MLFAAIANVAIGMAFALAAKDRIRADGPFATPAFPLAMLHAAGVVAPVALYFYAVHPSWAWHYLLDPARLPGIAVVPLTVAHATLVFAGWYGAAWLIRADRKRAVLYALGGLGVAFLVTALVLSRRLGTGGTYAEFQAGRGLDLLDVKLGYAVIVSFMATAASAGYIAVELVRDSRRVRSR